MIDNSVRNITQLRRAVEETIAATRTFGYMRGLIVKHTARNVISRHATFVKLFKEGHSGTSHLPRSIHLSPDERLDHEPTLAEWVDGAYLENTYLRMGRGGASLPVRMNRVRKLIDRARRVTIGTDKIDWLLDGVGRLLTKRADGAIIQLNLVRVDDPTSTLLPAVTEEKIQILSFPAPRGDDVLF